MALSLALVGLAVWRVAAIFPPVSRCLRGIGGPLLALVLVSAGLAGWGRLLLGGLGWRGAAFFSTAWSAGAVLSGTLLGVLWWLRFPPRWVVFAWLLAGAGLLWRQRAQVRPDAIPKLPGFRLWGWLFLAPPLLLALAPAISLDSLVYHLAMPAQYAQAGRAFEMPWHAHSYFPQLTSAVFALAMSLGGPTAAQLLHLAAAILALLVVARIGARLVSPEAGAWAALLLGSIPALNLPAGWAWNDWFVLLFLAGALELGLDARDRHSATSAGDDAGDFDLLLPRTLLAAGAAAVKYYALPALLLVGWRVRSWRRRLAQIALLALVLGPWYGKNLWQTGNPLWPLGSGGEASERLLHYRGEQPLGGRLVDLVGNPAILDESLGIVLPALLPLLRLVPALRSRRWLPFALLGGLYTGLLLGTNPSARAFSPLFLILALGIGAALASTAARWSAARGPGLRALAAAPLHALLLVNWLLIAFVASTRYEPVAPALGFEERQAYLASAQKYWPGFQWLAANAGPGDRVLVVGESRILYLPRPAIAGSYLDPHPLTHFLREGCDEACLEAELARSGVRWVYWDRSQYRIEAVGARGPVASAELVFQAEPLADAMFQQLLRRCGEERFREGPRSIYRLCV